MSGSTTPTGTGLGDGDKVLDDMLMELGLAVRDMKIIQATKVRTRIHSHVSAAVQEAIKESDAKYQWLCQNRAIISGNPGGAAYYWPGKIGEEHRCYPSVDALVSSEMLKEKANG